MLARVSASNHKCRSGSTLAGSDCYWWGAYFGKDDQPGKSHLKTSNLSENAGSEEYRCLSIKERSAIVLSNKVLLFWLFLYVSVTSIAAEYTRKPHHIHDLVSRSSDPSSTVCFWRRPLGFSR
jgi:hypothetical protein